MQTQVKTIASTAFIGKRVNMSFANNLTFQLWSGFMPE
jgi:hypothetical protein